MARRAARIDPNQPDLVQLFRANGVSVAVTSQAHDGFTDLVIGFGGVTVLVEVKDGSRIPSERLLTPKQAKFHASFKGAITVVETQEQCLELVRRIKNVSAQIEADWNVGAYANAGR